MPSFPSSGLPGPDDAPDALAAGFAAGDPACLARAYERWGGVVHTAALRALGDPAMAEDLTRRVFVLAWQAREKLTAGSGTVLGMLIRFTREQLALTLGGDRLPAAASEGQIDEVVRRVLTVDALGDLPADDRHILHLALYDDLAPDQIGQRLRIPPEAVRVRLRFGLEALRRRAEVNDDTAY